MEEILTVLSDPYFKARELSDAVGITPMHFPEELVHAAGLTPIILQESVEPVTQGLGHFYPFFCGFTRSNVDLAVKGKLDFLKAVIISDMCMQIRYMAQAMRKNMKKPFFYMLWYLDIEDKRIKPTVERLRKLRDELSDFTGRRIRDEDILESIKIYNRNRRLLKEIFDIRVKKPGVLSGREMVALVMSSMVYPKEEHNKLLERLKDEIMGRDGREGVRVYLSGHLCQALKPEIVSLVEELGGVIVGDDLYTGSRYINTELPEEGDPIENMARRYFDLPYPCPTRYEPGKDWARYLIEEKERTGAQGIIIFIVKYCEPHMLYYPDLRKRLDEARIPHIMIETEHEIISLESVRTRIGAFIEMLRGGR